jgi:molybdate transport system regulatory protein
MATRLTIRLDFDSGRRLGVGKIALLELIDKTRSISGAARALTMSYRRAWLLVAELNQLFSAPLVATHQGGWNGGGAALTDEGRQIVALYREAEAKMRSAAGEQIESIEQKLALLNSDVGRASSGRTGNINVTKGATTAHARIDLRSSAVATSDESSAQGRPA